MVGRIDRGRNLGVGGRLGYSGLAEIDQWDATLPSFVHDVFLIKIDTCSELGIKHHFEILHFTLCLPFLHFEIFELLVQFGEGLSEQGLGSREGDVGIGVCDFVPRSGSGCQWFKKRKWVPYITGSESSASSSSMFKSSSASFSD